MNVQNPETIDAIARQGMICAIEWTRQQKNIEVVNLGALEATSEDVQVSQDVLGSEHWSDEQMDHFRDGFSLAVAILEYFKMDFGGDKLSEKISNSDPSNPIKFLADLEDTPIE